MTKRYLVLLTSLVAALSSPLLAQPVGPEFQVNTYTTNDQDYASVASDASGNFVVVWQSGEYLGQGGGQDGSRYGVFGQRYDRGGNPLGGEFQVNTYTTSSQDSASVASDAIGNFIVVWESFDQDGSGNGVFGRRYDSGGNPLGGEFQVNTYTTSTQGDPSVASDADGNFVVVWYSVGQDGDDFGVFGQRYDSSGDPLGGEFRVNTYTTSRQLDPSIASDANGNFVVVWYSGEYPGQGGGQDGSGYGIFGQRYDSGGNPLGGEFRVNTYTTSRQWHPSVASDAGGNFVVVWVSLSQDGFTDGVFGQRYDSGGNPLGGEFQVNTYTTSTQSGPSIASDVGGNFVVVWNSFYQERSGNGIFGQRYNSGGKPLGGEFQVNTYTKDNQNSPSIASDASGNFIVVWESRGDHDGDSRGVFGQRFRNQANPVGCSDLRAARARCHNGDLEVGIALADGSHDGDTLTLRINGQDEVVTIHGHRAQTSAPGQGLNTLQLVTPPNCGPEKTVQCP